MILTYNELVRLVDTGVVEGVQPSQINGASIDVTLGRYLMVEDLRGGRVDLSVKQAPNMRKHDLFKEPYNLRPGEFVLAQTREVFHLPNDIAFEFKLKSSLARAGLNHLLAGFADPGWNGSVLTLEYQNVLRNHDIVLRYGIPAGQCVFYRGEPVPKERSYATVGQYNGDVEVTASKGVR